MAKSKRKRANAHTTMQHYHEEQIADQKDKAHRRMNPLTRNLLFGDLVLLAVAELLHSNGMMGDVLSNIITVIGAILMVIAVCIEVRKTPSAPDQPRLKLK